MIETSTIAAISTPPGKGGISIIRISGNKSFEIAKAIFRCNKKFENIKTHTVTYGNIVDNDEIIDTVILLTMKNPKSYTKEDIIEIQCHGGLEITKKILQLVYKHGALPANPGEFTKRAFLNGRIDLSQAEAVMDIINAETSKSEKAAINQLMGKTGKKIQQIRKDLIDLLSHINVSIDYPEYDDDKITIMETKKKTREIKETLKKLIANFETGIILREGMDVVIFGPPNAGKSTFINMISGEEKAIVTHIPGTTRDIIEVHMNIKGYAVNLFDTAGIRNTEDIIEKKGIEKTLKAIQNAKLKILVLDSSINDDDTKDIISKIDDKNIIIAINKSDLSKNEEIEALVKQYKVFNTSFINNVGVEEIAEEIYNYIDNGNVSVDDVAITNSRHKNNIEKAIQAIDKVLSDDSEFLDLFAIDLNVALEELSEITGESANLDLISNIFKNFCIGK